MRSLFVYLLFLFFLVLVFPVQAQEPDVLIDPILLRLRGRLVNKDDGLPVPYAHVVNLRTHGGTTTDEQGRFFLEMLNVDSLSISAMGYMKEYISIPPFQHEDSLLVIEVRPVRYAIGEVEVEGRAIRPDLYGISTGKPDSISPELRGDAYNAPPPWYSALFSPASFLQYHLSGREREKRNTRQAIISNQQWEYLSQWYNKDMVMKLTGLDEQEADSFMIYFNAKSVLEPRFREYDVKAAIVREFENYQKEKNLEGTGRGAE